MLTLLRDLTTSHYCIIDFANRIWYNNGNWGLFEHLNLSEAVSDREVNDCPPYMDQFKTERAYLKEINDDPQCTDCEVFTHFNTITELRKSYPHLFI